MKKFNEKNYEKIVSSNNKSVVFFTSKGCHLCKKLKPILESLEEQCGNSVDFYTTDFYLPLLNFKSLIFKYSIPVS